MARHRVQGAASDDVAAGALGVVAAVARGVGVVEAREHGQVVAAVAVDGDLALGEPQLRRQPRHGLALVHAGVGELEEVAVERGVDQSVRMLGDERLDVERKVRVLSELARMERHTLEGQALDLGWVRDGRWDLTTDDYLYMVRSKTAWYSAAVPLYVGALAAGASEEAARGLLELGLSAGVAFQLQDDLLNLVGDAAAQGKDFRSDVTEGKRTLAVVWALEHLDERDAAELVALLGSHATDPRELERAVCLIERGGGIEKCHALARELAEEAKARVAALARDAHISVEAQDLLISMADFFVERAL